jgi:hypothetical protein
MIAVAALTAPAAAQNAAATASKKAGNNKRLRGE